MDPTHSVSINSWNGFVRCFKDTPELTPQAVYSWQTESTCSTDEEDYTSVQLNPTTSEKTTATGAVTTNGLADGSYYLCVLS